ncbi:hypothetical protein [Ectobacillus ponti]|uniref:Uncharacterized protein n=1 Tax=Ectobacillus ponti TaxID=2961894 RepID=A0AA42BRF3_9BACI|nr:hypothetical protein [Ectobacillus ponti]MCP8969429.1 hypothetical protein [Ectobacillus ponti]
MNYSFLAALFFALGQRLLDKRSQQTNWERIVSLLFHTSFDVVINRFTIKKKPAPIACRSPYTDDLPGNGPAPRIPGLNALSAVLAAALIYACRGLKLMQYKRLWTWLYTLFVIRRLARGLIVLVRQAQRKEQDACQAEEALR